MLAFELRRRGWYLRQDIIWAKPNPMPESVKDRCTKSHEYIFLLSKSHNYYFDGEAIAEPIAESSIKRYEQDIERQKGSAAYGKTNGNMKAVAPRYGGKKYTETPEEFFSDEKRKCLSIQTKKKQARRVGGFYKTIQRRALCNIPRRFNYAMLTRWMS